MLGKNKKAASLIKEKDTEDTSKREGKAVKTEANGSTKDPKAAEVDSDTEDVLKVLACLTRPIKRRPLYSDSDEDQDGEDREDPTGEEMMQDHPLSEDPDAFLWYISEERYEELHQWSQTFGHKGWSYLLTWVLSNRVVGPGGPEKWLKNEEIDGLLYVFRENTTLKRWDVDRVGFMNFNFACCIKAAYEQWKSVKKKFEVSEYLMAFGKGGKHWIALCINFSERVIDVFDCNRLKRYREVDAFTHMVPRIMKEVQTGETKKNLSIAHIPPECHLLGRDVSLLNDENMKYARYKIASDLLQAGRDEVLLERMSRHVTPEFAPTETIDLMNDNHTFKWVDEAHLDEIEGLKMRNARLEKKLEAVTIERMEFERLVFEKVKMKIEEALVESSHTTKEMMIGAIVLCMVLGLVSC
ncbi:unnamed protein product [Microthlaspi erraticum]|uniref:Ubiquitin-like protease family profile domain-containing protein n=1 Tax=Microthlaspi erraticum TaxID=1685480 RepID=A0A6D2I882_9BRAS|nr:unnamed protein product [Microthlaspi erraticum]